MEAGGVSGMGRQKEGLGVKGGVVMDEGAGGAVRGTEAGANGVRSLGLAALQGAARSGP